MKHSTRIDFEGTPICADQNHLLEVLDLAAGAAFTLEMESGQGGINVGRAAAEEEPSAAVCIERLCVTEQLRGPFMLRVDRYETKVTCGPNAGPSFAATRSMLWVIVRHGPGHEV
jgi:hypothetical protein